jgi:hypothetical protein
LFYLPDSVEKLYHNSEHEDYKGKNLEEIKEIIEEKRSKLQLMTKSARKV